MDMVHHEKLTKINIMHLENIKTRQLQALSGQPLGQRNFKRIKQLKC